MDSELEKLMSILYQTKPVYTDVPNSQHMSADWEAKNYHWQFKENPLWLGLNHLYDQDPDLHTMMLKRLLDRGLNQDIQNGKRGAFTDTPPKRADGIVNKWKRY